jgi:hypothetical protein
MFKRISFAAIAAALGLSVLPVSATQAQDSAAYNLSDNAVPATIESEPPIIQAVPESSVLEPAPTLQYETSNPVAAPADCGCDAAPAAAPATCGCEAAPAKKCGCGLCKKKKAGKPSPCAGSHKPLFYDNDFSYLSKPDNKANCLGDCYKDLEVGPCGKLSLGGQMRWRYHNEIGMGQQAGATRFQDTENHFGLGRLRLYADWQVNNRMRFFAEGIYADVIGGNDEYINRGIDSNRGDFLNLFADINLDDRTTVRVGRQELLYGAQRLVSPLDWANTRRRFDGVKTMSKFDNFKLDTWYTQFVPVVPTEFDTPDEDRHFWGAYGTLTGLENKTVDLYYLGLNDNRGANGTEAVHTFGSRIQGNTQSKLLYEFEGMVQNGSRDLTDQSLTAWALTGGLGYKFAERPWKPALWFFYDYASGDDPTGGSFTRFNDLFPLGHKYLGFIDAVLRRNIISPNVRLAMSPTKKLGLLLWYHNFRAADPDDTILSLGGTPAQNTASADFGNELDFVATYKVNARNSALIGYSHFWRGARITGDTDADFLYMQWTTNF